MKKICLLLLLVICHDYLNAQVKIGGTNTNIKNASLLELESTNKGLVFPRVSLTALDSRLPLASDIVSGTVVYNINTNLSTGAGLVVWKDGRWSALLGADASGVSVTDSVYSASEISSVNIPAYKVTIVGSRAYVAGMSSGMFIFNISNPTAPVLIGSFDPAGSVADVAVSGNFAYLPARIAGIYIVNISNPANPTLVGTYNTGAASAAMTIIGTTGYVVNGRRLDILNLSTPASPVQIGSYATASPAFPISNVQIQGALAFLSVEQAGMHIVNLANPASPALIGSYNSPADGHDIVADGTYAYLAAGAAGLHIVKISSPASPAFVGNYTVPNQNYVGVRVQGDIAYICDRSFGLRVFSIRDRENPVLIDSFKVTGTSEALAINGNDLYLSNTTRGLHVLRMGSDHNTINITKDKAQLAALSNPQGRGIVMSNDSGSLSKAVVGPGILATNGLGSVTAVTYIDTIFRVAITDLNATVVYDSTSIHAVRIGNQLTLNISGHLNLTIPNQSSITLESIPQAVRSAFSSSNYSMFVYQSTNNGVRGVGSGYISGSEITLYSNANPQGNPWNGPNCGFTTFTITTLID